MSGMTAIAFTVHGHAAPAGSKKAFKHRSTGRVMVVDASERSKPWKHEVKAAAVDAVTYENDGKRLYRPPLDGPLLLEVTFWIPRPKGHYGTGRNAGTVRASAAWAPTVKPDLLKLARAVEDALTGICYRDDAQIVTEILEKAYTTGPARTEIRITPIQPPGQHRPLPARQHEAAA